MSGPGWCLDEEGRLRRETIHSMLRRLPGWDYRGRAIYQITITLADRPNQALGRLKVKVREGAWLDVAAARQLGLKPEEVEARVELTPFGEVALAALREMPRLFPAVEILAVQIMPDHIHFIVFVKEALPKPLGLLIRGFKAGASKRWKEICSVENGREQNSSAENGREQNRSGLIGAAGCVPANSFVGCPAWSDGFQDTVLLHRDQLDNMFNYLRDNPRRLAVKRLFPELFKVIGELKLDLAVGGEAVGPKAPRFAVGRFAALGNRFLIDRPLAQVQVSRRDFAYRRESKPGGGQRIARDATGLPLVDFATPFFEEKKAALFAAAKHGHALVSPCVSDGEREIARLALAAGLPLVTLHNKGFSPIQKPGGRYFDACADGRLLMLAPAAWPYLPGEKKMTRFDAVALNRLAQLLAGDGAAEINYHGMQPSNIDDLAFAAVKIERKTPND